MLSADAYESLRSAPTASPSMRQIWRSLLFLHVSCEPSLVQSLLPEGLTVDTFDDKAWIGLVPFRMESVRPVWSPIGFDFPETNVRTYVHRNGAQPGVWFFSLEATNALACAVARRWFGLPYHESKMTVVGGPQTREYRSSRRSNGLQTHVRAELGAELDLPVAGSLEFFLVERYLLYALRQGQLMTGRVHHAPYRLRSVSSVQCADELVRSHGLPWGEVESALYSDGVDVTVYPVASPGLE